MPGESYRRRLRSFLCLCDVFRALINSLVCWFCTGALGLVLFPIGVSKCSVKVEIDGWTDVKYWLVDLISAGGLRLFCHLVGSWSVFIFWLTGEKSLIVWMGFFLLGGKGVGWSLGEGGGGGERYCCCLANFTLLHDALISNWILMSRVTPGQSNSGHKQMHISKLLIYIYMITFTLVVTVTPFALYFSAVWWGDFCQ